jgi:hypothetical protein
VHKNWHRVDVKESYRERLFVSSCLLGRDVYLNSVTLNVDHNSDNNNCCCETNEIRCLRSEKGILELPKFVWSSTE